MNRELDNPLLYFTRPSLKWLLTISKSNLPLSLEIKILPPLTFFKAYNLYKSQRRDQVSEMLFVYAAFYISYYMEMNKN